MVDVFIFGEKHANEKHAKQQASFIRRKKPEWVLHEGFGDEINLDIRVLLDTDGDTAYHRKMRILGRAIKCSGSKIGGCDPTLPYTSEIKYWDIHNRKIWYGMVHRDPDGSLNVTPAYIKNRYISKDKRSEMIGRLIAAYVKLRNTDRPIVAIVGALHLKNDSIILKTLDSFNISYKSIQQQYGCSVLPKKSY